MFSIIKKNRWTLVWVMKEHFSTISYIQWFFFFCLAVRLDNNVFLYLHMILNETHVCRIYILRFSCAFPFGLGVFNIERGKKTQRHNEFEENGKKADEQNAYACCCVLLLCQRHPVRTRAFLSFSFSISLSVVLAFFLFHPLMYVSSNHFWPLLLLLLLLLYLIHFLSTRARFNFGDYRIPQT